MSDWALSLDRLLKRGLAGSLTLFSMLLAAEAVLVVYAGKESACSLSSWRLWSYLGSVFSQEGGALSTLLFLILVLVGLSYGLAVLNELLYSYTLRQDFDSLAPRKLPYNNTMADNLTELRRKVVSKLRHEGFLEFEEAGEDSNRVSDYFLYELVGGLLPETDTRGYVDSAKTMGTTFVSASLVLVTMVFLHPDCLEEGPSVVALVLALFILWVGREAVKTHYRSRAIRLYVNYLAQRPKQVDPTKKPE